MPELTTARISSDRDIPCLARDVQTDDADCLAQSISGWSQEYEQLKAGHFHGSLSELCFGSSQLFLEQTSHALRQVCKVPVGHVWFGLPSSNDSRCVRINGVPVMTGRIALHRGGTDFELVTPDQLQFWGVVVSDELLMSYALQFECEAWLAKVLERPVLGVNEARKQAVQQVCNQILLTPRLEEGRSLAPSLRQSLSDNTLSALFSLFHSLEPVSSDRCSSRQRHRLVERVDAYVRSHSDRLVTVSEQCSELSISRRALQAAFQDVLGVSPHAYIRAVSLNKVRSHLKNANSPYNSVQDAAAAYGFWHMSQFALDYRQLFGELPSATIKRRAGIVLS
jgi:AraC family ethanolamine operon transcriptional activator